MDWIKKHYDQFALGLVAVVVLALAILLFLKIQSFPEKFSEAVAPVPESDKVQPVVLDKIDEANAILKNPPKWDVDQMNKGRGSFFVSQQYVLGKSGPEKLDKGAIYKCSLDGKPIPNTWFTDRGLPLFDPTVPFQDPDKDGFPNEIEFAHNTDPKDPNSHPPYYAMLYLKQIIRVPFRLKFQSYDGDPRRDKVEKFEFGINTVDVHQPSQFLKLGDTVANTKFKLEKFEFKERVNPGTQDKEDVSELTVVNTETGDHAVLILDKVVDSPDYFVQFDYQWPSPPQPPLRPLEFRVKRLGSFVLRPNTTAKDVYKLIDIKENSAVIQLPDGQKTPEGATTVEITRDPRRR